MAHHSVAALTIAERLEQLELDMTVVHDAISRLAERIDLITEAVVSRDQSHLDAVEAQIARTDDLLGQLRDDAVPTEAPAEAPVNEHAEAPASSDFTWQPPA